MAQVKFRDLNQAATKLQTNGASAQKNYVTNASAAGGTWATNTAAAEPNFEAGIQKAIANGNFGKGVQKAGAGKYTAQINAVAGPRFGDGMSKAGPAWTKGFQPIAAFVAGVDVGPRGPRGSQQNKQRSSATSDAFMAARQAQLG